MIVRFVVIYFHNMTASITILSFNRFYYLKNTIESLLKSLNDRSEVEIIVVDNGSADESPAYIKNLLEKKIIDKAILYSENQGISKGFNSGFAISNPKSKYLIKLDCDIVIHDKGWLEEMDIIFTKHEEIGLLMLYQKNHPILPNCKRTKKESKEFISLEEMIVGSACFTIPKKTIDLIGYFFEDHSFTLFYDDIDYFIRLEILGKKAFYILSHQSSHQFNLDETKYLNYNQQKEHHYDMMNEFNKTLEQKYLNGAYPLKRTYNRFDSLANKAKSTSVIEY